MKKSIIYFTWLIFLIFSNSIAKNKYVLFSNEALKEVPKESLKPINLDQIPIQYKWLLPLGDDNQKIEKSKKVYWQSSKIGKGSGWKPYKRAEEFWKHRGEAKPKDLINIFNQKLKSKTSKDEKVQFDNEWKFIGPKNKPIYNSNLGPTGLGRINVITFDPKNPNIIWAGAAAGGIWRSTNSGGNWESFPLTQFMSIGISDIAVATGSSTISPIVYAATGDADAAFGGINAYSIGVIKTTDFGKNWQITNFSSQIDERLLINRIIVDPNDENRVFAATTRGLFLTEDGGQTWDTLTNAYTRDLELVPNNNNRLWAAFIYGDGTNVYYGLFSIQIIPREGKDSVQFFASPLIYYYGDVIRMSITVNPNDPGYVYILSAKNEGRLHSVIYTPNSQEWYYLAQTLDNQIGAYTWDLLNVYSDIPDSVGNTNSQGFYDLCIVANPDDPLDVYIGGVNIWQFQKNSYSWKLHAYWTEKYKTQGVPYVHADHHDLKISKNGILYSANDGGIAKYSYKSKNWDDISDGLEITQFYRINSSQRDPGMIISGAQDNGTNLLLNNHWYYVRGGDGMDCQIDPFDDNVIYTSLYYGQFYVSRDKGDSFQLLIDSTITKEDAEWVAPFEIDPVYPDYIYVGFENLWKANRKGLEPFLRISNFQDKEPIRHIAISRDNNNIIYIIKPKGVWRTTDGGKSWTNIIQGNGDIALTSIAIDPKDPLHIWISRGAYVEGEKVFELYGNSFFSVSDGLPNVPANCIVYDRNSNNHQMFLATDVGVYYINDDLKEWEPYGFGLPNVIVQDLDINYSAGKIRAATFGRGLWEAKIVKCVIDPPAIQIIGNKNFCEGDSVILSVEGDYVSYEWNTGDTTKSIVVKETGSFYVKIIDINGCSATSEQITVTKVIPPEVNIKTNTGSYEFCEGDSIRLDATPSLKFKTFEWSNGDVGKSIWVKESGTYSVIGITNEGCKKQSSIIELYILPKPDKPTITVQGNKLESSDAVSYQWYLNGEQIPGAKSKVYFAKISGNYAVEITDDKGCKNISDEIFLEIVSVQDKNNFYISIKPNPVFDNFEISIPNIKNRKASIKILDILGNTLIEDNISNIQEFERSYDMTNYSNGYYIVEVKIGTEIYHYKLIHQ